MNLEYEFLGFSKNQSIVANERLIKGKTLKAVADILNVTPERVRGIESKVFQKINNRMIFFDGQRRLYDEVVPLLKNLIEENNKLKKQVLDLQITLGKDVGFENNEELKGISLILSTSIEGMPLSARTHNCLKNENILTIRDIIAKSDGELLKLQNFGRKSLREIKETIKRYGFNTGMIRNKEKL